MKKKLAYNWNLRQFAATRGIFSTTDLIRPLAERGVELSPVQVYRLVVQTPERLSLRTLVALCDILDCTPNDLIEPVIEEREARQRKAAAGSRRGSSKLRPKPARIVPRQS